MKKLFILVAILFAAYLANSQNVTDTIRTEKRLGTVFLQNDKLLTVGDLKQLAKPYPLAKEEMKKAMSNYTVGSIFSYAGGFLVGYPLGVSLGGGEPQWAMAAVGAGLIVIAIPFSIGYTKHAKSAVRIINGELQQIPVSQLDLRFTSTPNGAGLVLSF